MKTEKLRALSNADILGDDEKLLKIEEIKKTAALHDYIIVASVPWRMSYKWYKRPRAVKRDLLDLLYRFVYWFRFRLECRRG